MLLIVLLRYVVTHICAKSSDDDDAVKNKDVFCFQSSHAIQVRNTF